MVRRSKAKRGTQRRVRQTGGAVMPTKPRTSSGTINGFEYAIGEHAGYKEHRAGVQVKYNEDRSAVNALGSTGLLVVVCDGHGGDQISQKVITELPPYLTSQITDETLKDNEQVKSVIKSGIAQMVQNIAPLGMLAKKVGTTCTVAVITPSSIVIGYLGDSPAVLMTKDGQLVAETIDHDFDNAAEVTRLNNMYNAMSENDKYTHGPPIKSDEFGVKRLKGNLAMSRSLGDLYMLPYLSAEPDFMVLPRGTNQRLLVGSDSLKEAIIPFRDPRTGRSGNRIGSALEGTDIVNEVTPVLNGQGTLEERIAEVTSNRVNKFYYPGLGYQGDNTMIVDVELPDVATPAANTPTVANNNNNNKNGYFGKSNIYGGGRKRKTRRRKGRRGYNRH